MSRGYLPNKIQCFVASAMEGAEVHCCLQPLKDHQVGLDLVK